MVLSDFSADVFVRYRLPLGPRVETVIIRGHSLEQYTPVLVSLERGRWSQPGTSRFQLTGTIRGRQPNSV